MANSVILALGSNLGDKKNNILRALELLKKFSEIIKISSNYNSKALLKENSPKEWDMDFLNCVILLETDLQLRNFFEKTKEIENIISEGKREKNNWSPRKIDIDIIDWNNEIIEQADLTIPHSRIHERDFVLVPLYEIQPQYEHPKTGLSLRSMVKAVTQNNLVKTELKLETAN